MKNLLEVNEQDIFYILVGLGIKSMIIFLHSLSEGDSMKVKLSIFTHLVGLLLFITIDDGIVEYIYDNFLMTISFGIVYMMHDMLWFINYQRIDNKDTAFPLMTRVVRQKRVSGLLKGMRTEALRNEWKRQGYMVECFASSSKNVLVATQ